MFIFSYVFQKTPLTFLVQSFWRDESFSYLMAQQNILTMFALTAKDFNPPLYYLLLRFWSHFFGSSEITLRMLSFFFFLGTLYVTGLYLLFVLKFPIKKTFAYLLLFILNPLLHYYAFEARMYSMFAFFSILSIYTLHKKKYVQYAIVSVLNLYTHYFAVISLFAQALFIFLTQKKKWRYFIKLYGVIFASYIPWIIMLLLNHPLKGEDFWIPKMTFNAFLLLPSILFTGYEDFLSYTYPYLPLLSIFLYGFICITVYTRIKTKKIHLPSSGIGFWVIISIIIVSLISLKTSVFLPRYLIFVTIGLLLFLVQSMEYLNFQKKIIVYIILLVFSLHYSSVQIEKRKKDNIRKPLLEIKQLIKKDDRVYVTHVFDFHTAQYYIDTKRVFIYDKTYEEIPSFVGKVLIPKTQITNSLPIYPKKAFIIHHSLTYSIQSTY